MAERLQALATSREVPRRTQARMGWTGDDGAVNIYAALAAGLGCAGVVMILWWANLASEARRSRPPKCMIKEHQELVRDLGETLNIEAGLRDAQRRAAKWN